MKITQIRNATIIVEYANRRFLVDPWLCPKESMAGFDAGINPQIRQPRVELPFTQDKITNVDAVILTHFHPDHFDDYAVKALDKEIKFFVQSKQDYEIIQSKGFTNIEILTEKGNLYQNITMYKTKCQHGKREIIKPLCEQIGMPYDAMGIVFKAKNEKTLYLAGDTIWCEEVKESLNTYTPDVIIVNACGATVQNGEHIIMNISDIEEVIAHSPKSTIIASHMDTVSHLTVTREDLKKYIKEKNITNILVPNDGETIEL